MASILLAEDDENLGFLVKDNLSSLGHHVIWAKDGKEAILEFFAQTPELCLVDIMMPHMDGFEVAEQIRAKDEYVPILFLTARSDEEDRLRGFEIGADDYITKPFSMKELSYRINVFLKRSVQQTDLSDEKICFGNCCFDPVNVCVEVNGQLKALTQMEGKLLKLLVDHQNQLIKREEILEQIWGENDYFKGRSLDVFITRMRKYLKEDPQSEIKNHHGIGFSLVTRN